MESPTEAAAADPAARSFSQVVFTGIPHSYPPSTSVTCCYTLTSAFQPNPRDWVGIFKVGWSSTKDYHTFVWVEPCLDVVGQQAVTKQAFFKEYYLPKDDIEFYQFCYIDSTGQVRGASTPFCFKNPVEQSLENSPDDDLLVITTQEQVEQSVREKAELMKELDQIRGENETLKSTLQREQQEVQNLKGQKAQREKQMSEIVTEMDQIKEENKQLKSTVEEQLTEADRLKEEMMMQMTKTLEMQQQNQPEQKQMSQSLNLEDASRQNEKYDRALMKINQLKEEREELRRMNDVKSTEIDELKSKLREGERELLKMTDSIQLLQVDLQSSGKEKVRLSAEVQRLHGLVQNTEEVQEEIRTLRRSLSQQETLQKCPDDDLRVKCQTLLGQLQEAQALLAAEKEESRNTRRRNEFLEQELQKVMEQLQVVASSSEETQRRINKQELLLTEAHAAIADKDSSLKDQEHVITLMSHEKEELANENQNLQNEIERLSRVYAESPHAQPEPVYDVPSAATASAHEQQQNTPEQSDQSENLYEIIDDIAEPEEEQSLVCRHCQESFPGITQSELDQHEQSHRVCPFCTMICDNMEQSVFEDHVYSHEL